MHDSVVSAEQPPELRTRARGKHASFGSDLQLTKGKSRMRISLQFQIACTLTPRGFPWLFHDTISETPGAGMIGT